jgi:hypothetical protein
MKKSVVVLMVALSCASMAQAAESKVKLRGNGFQDNFSLVGASISSLQTDGNLRIASQSGGSFVVSDRDPNVGNGGSVTLRASNKFGACELVIEDGAFQMNPTVVAVNCMNGLTYAGMDHPYGSYQYTLKFK